MAKKKVLSLDLYGTQNIEEVGALTYSGKQDGAGNWLVVKMDESSGISILYATVKNNPTVTSYALAWTNRAILIYGGYPDAF